MAKNLNTYISISIMIWHDDPTHSIGRIYTSVEDAKLDLHMEVDVKAAKRELAKLMLRTGKMPDVRRGELATHYSLSDFLT